MTGVQTCALPIYVDGADYSKAELTVVYYEKNADGVWEKVNIARDKLSKFDISDSLIHILLLYILLLRYIN